MLLLHVCFNTIVFVGTLGILIIVHECGHFLVARFFKVQVKRFSIGFGPVLWRKIDSKGTEYTISAIFLGGYVKLKDSAVQESNNCYSSNNSFYQKYIWKKSCIILAGPVFNFIFSILLYIIVFVIGISQYKPIINYILPNSIIAQCDMPIGSQIKSINEVNIGDWESVRLQILNNINKEKIVFLTEIVDSNHIISKTNTICLPINWFNQSDLGYKDPIILFGIFPNFLKVTSIISEKKLHIFNKQDNLKINDKILLINGQLIYNWDSFVRIMNNNFNKKFSMVIERDGHVLNLDFSLIETRFIDFIKFQKNMDLFFKTVIVGSSLTAEIYQCGLYTAMLKACQKVCNDVWIIMCELLKLIDGNVKVTSLHGPIAIGKIAGQMVHQGIICYLLFLSIISINLGIINLLPLPMLDGGQLLILFVETIKGRSIFPKTQNFIYIISFIILIIIMCITVRNDIGFVITR